jgi:hypothetical protein
VRLIPPNLPAGCHGRHRGDLIHAFPKARFIEDLGQFEIPLPSHGERGAPWRRPHDTCVHHGHHRTRGFQEAFALQTISLSIPRETQAQVVAAEVGREPEAMGDPHEPRAVEPGAPAVDPEGAGDEGHVEVHAVHRSLPAFCVTRFMWTSKRFGKFLEKISRRAAAAVFKLAREIREGVLRPAPPRRPHRVCRGAPEGALRGACKGAFEGGPSRR